MKGIVGVIAHETSRYTKFWGDLQNLEAPDGVEVHINYDGTLGQGRNQMVQQFLQTDAGWLVMIDDDHAISPSYLRSWLHRHEFKLNTPVRYPICASLYLQRSAPFGPALYGPPQVIDITTFADKGKKELVSLPHLSISEFPTSGMHAVYAAGASGLFVRRDVYERMPQPWYELGQSDNIGEDFWFCHKAQKLGVQVWVDLDCRLGHIAPFEVWPDVIEGKWATSIRRRGLGIVIDSASTEALTAAQLPAEVLA